MVDGQEDGGPRAAACGSIHVQRPSSSRGNPEDNSTQATSHMAIVVQKLWIFPNIGDILRYISPITLVTAATPRIARSLMRYMYPFLAAMHRVLFARRRHLNYLERSIHFSRKALATIPDNHPTLPHYQQRLGCALYDRFICCRDLRDLRTAVELQRTAVAHTPPTDANFHWHAMSLNTSLFKEFENVGELRTINDAIALESRAVEHCEGNKVRLAWWQHALASSHRRRFNLTNQAADLEAALKWVNLHISNNPDPDHLFGQVTHASILRERFKAQGAIADIDAAISKIQSVIENTPQGNEDRASRLQFLGNLFNDRFDHTGRKEDLDQSIVTGREAMKLVAPDNHVLPSYQHNLSLVLRESYWLERRREDLEEAIKYSKAAAQGIQRDNKYRCYIYRHLGGTLLMKYKQYGALEDLELALKWLNEALAATHPMDRNNFKIYVDLGELHQGNMEDLETAMTWIKSALASSSGLRLPELAFVHQSLGSLHRNRWQRLRQVEDLDAAIQNKLLSVQETPSTEAELYNRQSNLAISYMDRYRQCGDRKDQEQGLKWLHRSVDLAPPGHSSRVDNLSRLSHEYGARYAWMREEQDLDKAIEYALQAVDLLPENTSNPILCTALALCYYQKADLNHDAESTQNAYLWFRRHRESHARPEEAWVQANEWAKFADRHEDKEECFVAYTHAMRTLPDLLWIGSKVTVRHETLQRYDIASVTSAAVDACISYDALEKAVEFVEQGLAITFQQLLDLRDDHADLQKAHPSLADELKDLSNLLQAISNDPRSDDTGAGSRLGESERRRTADQREKLLERIRNLPGFENFLLPKPFSELHEAAKEGPVVLVVNTNRRGTALILTQSGVAEVPLQGTSTKAVNEQLDKLRDGLSNLGIQARKDYQGNDPNPIEDAQLGEEDQVADEVVRKGRLATRKKDPAEAALNDVLGWLWERVVSAVLDKLAQNGITGGRIWWCPTGPFTYLPIHAAGPPNDFIHSYTSTLGALIRARNDTQCLDPKITVIGLSEFKKASITRLPSVLEEIERVEGVARDANVSEDAVVVLVDEQATLDTVTEVLEKSSWLHLACHGQQDTKNPLKSGLLLYDAKLELEKLMEMPLPDAEFVFLSACETAMGDKNMTNESLHLAGGMLFAGFKGAIGTLWSISDADGPVVAEQVYREIFTNKEKPDAKDAASALHDAIQSLRGRGVPPHRWVPFIHMGI